MPREIKISACQYVVREIASFDDMAKRVRALLDAADGSDIAIFPELFTIELFTTIPGWRELLTAWSCCSGRGDGWAILDPSPRSHLI